MNEIISIEKFISVTLSDIKSPVTSDFGDYIPSCRYTVHELEQNAEEDRNTLNKIRKAIKTINQSGTVHAQNEAYLCDQLDKLGSSGFDATEREDNEIGSGMYKFCVILRELSRNFKQLMQNLHSIVLSPLDTFLKGDIKNDLKRPFDKAWKDYDAKFDKIRRERLQAARDANLYRTDVKPSEVAEEMETERRNLQLQMCEYLIKVNELKSKKGAELLQHFIEFFHAQSNYLEDSLKSVQHLLESTNDLVDRVNTIQTTHDEQKRQLIATREELRKSVDKTVAPKGEYNIHQPQGNKAYGTRKLGFLLKKSDGKVTRIWQKRRVRIDDGVFTLYHADESKAPVRLPLLTCQVKKVQQEEPRKGFTLVSNNRTYHFQADDDVDEWIAILNNAKQEVFDRAMRSDNSGASLAVSHGSSSSLTDLPQSSVSSPGQGSQSEEQTWRKVVLREIQDFPGNERCCDCEAPDPEWCSVNLGVLICLECCGVHRDLGVHYSRTQSLVMDDLTPDQLLLPRFIGNSAFNDVFEATLADGIKPRYSEPNSDLEKYMQQRKHFIRAKYVDRRYVNQTASKGLDERYLRRDLLHAVRNCDLSMLLQVYGEQCSLMSSFLPEDDEDAGRLHNTSLHVAMETRLITAEDPESSHPVQLALVEFIVQNVPSAQLQQANQEGDTILHYAVRFNRLDFTKLILKAGGVSNQMLSLQNSLGQTPLDVAEQSGSTECAALLHTVTMITTNQNERRRPGQSDPFACLNVRWREGLGRKSSQENNNAPIVEDCFHDDQISMMRRTTNQGVGHGDARSDSVFIASNRMLTARPISEAIGIRSRSSPSYGLSVSPSDLDPSEMKRTRSDKGPAARPPPKTKPPPPPPSQKPRFLLKSSGDTGDQYPSSTSSGDEQSPSSEHIDVVLEMLMETSDQPIPKKRMSKSSTSSPSKTSGDSTTKSIASSPAKTKEELLSSVFVGKRVCALLDNVNPEHPDELVFSKGEVIKVTRAESEEWWAGYIETAPHRKGMFPVPFVHILSDS